MSRLLKNYSNKITCNYSNNHKAIDIVGNDNGASKVDYILSHSAGEVIKVRKSSTGFESGGSYGNYVLIKHDNGYQTRYAHLAYNSITVKVGEVVPKAKVIGYMGNTGTSYGAHLHFEVINNTGAKIDPTPYLESNLPNNSEVDVYYQVKTKKYGWLPEVKNLEDYAGYKNDPITSVKIRVTKGTIKYRVHNQNGSWLPYVTGSNINDSKNGYAGNNNVIDAIEVYYYTPSDIRPYKKAKYKVNNYSYQYDNEKGGKMDGYAGKLGTPITKFQIIIE